MTVQAAEPPRPGQLGLLPVVLLSGPPTPARSGKGQTATRLGTDARYSQLMQGLHCSTSRGAICFSLGPPEGDGEGGSSQPARELNNGGGRSEGRNLDGSYRLLLALQNDKQPTLQPYLPQDLQPELPAACNTFPVIVQAPSTSQLEAASTHPPVPLVNRGNT